MCEVTQALEAGRASRVPGSRLSAILDRAIVGMLLLNARRDVLWANHAMEQLCGYGSGALAGMAQAVLIHADDLDSDLDLFEALLAGSRDSYEIDRRYVRADGQVIRCRQTVTRVQEQDDAVSALVLVSATTAPQELLLAQSSEQLQILHEIDRAILEARSPRAIAEGSTARLRQVSGCTRATVCLFDFAAQEVEFLCVSTDRETSLPTGARARADLDRLQEIYRDRGVYVSTDLAAATEQPPAAATLVAEGLHAHLSVPLMPGDALMGCLNLSYDQPRAIDAATIQLAHQVATSLAVAIQNARLLEQVQRDHEALHTLTGRLLQAQEDERHSLARELHDESGQSLTALKIGLDILARRCRTQSPELLDQVNGLRESAEAILVELNRLARRLRPASLDKLGLSPAVRQHIEAFAEQTGIQVDFQPVRLSEGRLPRDVETVLYRVIQEALTNVARHSGASEASVVLERQQNRVVAIIEDAGQGFDLKEALARGRMGLAGMRERAEMLDGSLTIESRIGSGTTVYVELPCAALPSTIDTGAPN